MEGLQIVDIDINNLPVVEPVAKGEYNLEVAGAEIKMSAQGKPYINMRIINLDHPDSRDLYEVLSLPNSEDDEKKKAQKGGRIRDFVLATGFPWTGMPDFCAAVEDRFKGLQFRAFVKLENIPNSSDRQNRVDKYIAKR